MSDIPPQVRLNLKRLAGNVRMLADARVLDGVAFGERLGYLLEYIQSL